MTATLPQPESSYEPCPAGTHVARCISVIDLGTSEDTYDGETRKRHQLMLTFETPLELMEDGEPYTISGWYTWSMNERAKLRQHLEAWRGKPFSDSDFGENGFHISKLLDKPCTITVSVNEHGKHKLTGISPVMKGMDVPPKVNPLTFVWLDKDEFKQAAFDGLSDRLKERIMQSPEYQALRAKPATSAPIAEYDETEIPF